jgi:hypothetical protein
MRWQMDCACAVTGDEQDLLALDPGMDDGNRSINSLNNVCHSVQGKAHATDHCQFFIHQKQKDIFP